MRSIFVAAALACVASGALAQQFDYSLASSWKDVPEKHKLNPAFDSSGAVGILEERNVEYKVENKEIALYNSVHRIIHINNDKGIEMFNKIYIALYDGDVMNLKARTVLSNGKVIDLPANKVNQIEEEGRKYKLFAMEGLEKGAEIEYSYQVKKNTTYFGSEVFQSSSIPYQQVRFTLAVPKHLKFDAKGYNGIKVSTDSLIGDQRIIIGVDENVPDLDDEKYAEKDPYLHRVDYKLSYNLSSAPDVRMFTWKDFAKRAFNNYTMPGPKDEKPLNSFVSQMKIADGLSEEKKIIAVEDFIKTSINVDKNLIGEDVSTLERIAKTRNTDNFGINRLYALVFDKLGVNYQIVFAGRRDAFPLDEELENWNRIDETAFYFPSTGKYLSPVNVELRYPYIPAYWAGSKGLFLKGTTIGSFKTAIGTFNNVEMIPFENHAHNMEVTVKFNNNLDTLLINSKQIAKGYGAASYRPVYAFLPKDKQDEANMQIVKSVAESNDITNIKVENVALTDFADNKPYTISADIKNSSMIESAGNKVLLKIGEIIGPQVEMYQEKPRQLPIELPYPHVLNRTVKLVVPKGYQIKNLNDLNFSIQHKEGDDVTMAFISNYSQDGDNVVININEMYKNYHYPIEQFDDFRKVINASADFNKVVLVLEKKG